MQQSGLLIRGFEPSLLLNESFHGVAQILSQQVPEHLNALLGGAHSKKGYSVADGAAFIGALERLVFDAESELLNTAYKLHRTPFASLLGKPRVRVLLETYMVHWMLGDDTESIQALMRNRSLLDSDFPHWGAIKAFLDGRIRTLAFEQSQNPSTFAADAVMMGRYSFDDAHRIVGDITHTFQQFWQSECATMKQQLVDMDLNSNGRVGLSQFYGTGVDKDWRFAESEEYLRALGVLDESSVVHGKQVMIANYLQAASNCIVSTPHYLICCENECETLLREIEIGIKSPMAAVDDVLRIVGNLSSSSSEDDEPPLLSGSLVDQLMTIADSYDGKVPIHGRLFAQWLHYAYPRECPFPHTAGKFAHHTLTPDAFGDNFMASQDVMTAANQTDPEDTQNNSNDWMSEWSKEEELFADYTHLLAPWEDSERTCRIGFVVAVLLFSVFTVVMLGTGAASASTSPPSKNHLTAPVRGHVV